MVKTVFKTLVDAYVYMCHNVPYMYVYMCIYIYIYVYVHEIVITNKMGLTRIYQNRLWERPSRSTFLNGRGRVLNAAQVLFHKLLLYGA